MARRMALAVIGAVSACSTKMSRTVRMFSLRWGFEAEGVCVAVDDRPVRQVVVLDDVVGAVPVEEIVFDLGALRVMADMALTGVALEVCPRSAEPAASGDFVDLHVRSFFLFCEAPLLRKSPCLFRCFAAIQSNFWFRRIQNDLREAIAETTQAENGGD
jgi:hypothetical protein